MVTECVRNVTCCTAQAMDVKILCWIRNYVDLQILKVIMRRTPAGQVGFPKCNVNFLKKRILSKKNWKSTKNGWYVRRIEQQQ